MFGLSSQGDFTTQRAVFILLVGLLSVGLVSLASLFIYTSQKTQLRANKHQQMGVEAELMGGFLREYLLRNDYAEAVKLMQGWPETHTEVVSLSAVLDNGTELFAMQRQQQQARMQVERKIGYGDRSLTLILGHSMEGLNLTLQRLANELVGFSLLLTLFTGLVLWYLLFRWTIRPMELEIQARTQDLQLSEERFRRLAENAKDMIYRMSLPDGRYEYVSPAAQELLGYTPEEFYAEPQLIQRVIHPDSRAYLEAQWQRLLRGDIPTSYEYRVIHKSGEVRWLHQRNSLIRDEAQQPIAIEGIVTDITEAKRDAEQLLLYRDQLEEMVEARTEEMRCARDEAERANQAKSEFLSSMSHELRTPLNAILGFAQLLELDYEEDANAPALDNVQEIITAGRHLLELINDLLELTKIEAGKLQVNTGRVHLARLLEECSRLMATQVQQQHLQLQLPSADQCPAVRADPVRLKQVVLNLLSNAVKYNRAGGRVVLHCAPAAQQRVRLSVTDTGKGIAVPDQAKLFVPFNRLGAECSNVKGTGIGLVISKRLVELMGGRMGFSSTLGQGSTFWVELASAPQGTEPAPSAAQSASTKSAADDCCCRVLYIEDNLANRRLVQQVLARLGHVEMQTAEEGPPGLRMAREQEFDLVLIDINLPGLSGLEIAQALRRLPAYRSTPILALSADAMQADIDRALASGFDYYITKPIDIADFSQRMRELLPSG